MATDPPFSEAALRSAVGQAECWSDALRALGYEPKGHNYRTIRRWVSRWGVSVDHFDRDAGRRRAGQSRATPLSAVLVEHSTYHRGKLKERLLQTGLKEPLCEICGQGETWRGRQMSLILDHINGVADDNRLENLRIVCPNCNATLDTHCGRNLPRVRTCPACERSFSPKDIRHRYCSRACWGVEASRRYLGRAQPQTRRVERPPHERLRSEVAELGFSAVGRKYGVSDNAVRKWIRWYERQQGDGPGEPAA